MKNINILEKYNETKSLAKTAKFFKTTSFKIKKILKANNFDYKTKRSMGRARTYDLDNVVERIKSGEDIKLIAKNIGISLYSLRTMICKNKKLNK